MKKSLLLLSGFAICLASLPVVAPAQSLEAGGFGGALRMGGGGNIGPTPVDPTTAITLQNKWLFGFRGTINVWERFGHDITYAYQRTAIQSGAGAAASGTAIHTVTYGMLAYATKQDSRVRPFAQGGVGFSNFIFPGSSVNQFGGGSRKFGLYYGGGIKFKPIDDKPYWVRFDYRIHETGKPYGIVGQSGWLRRDEIAVGIYYGWQ